MAQAQTQSSGSSGSVNPPVGPPPPPSNPPGSTGSSGDINEPDQPFGDLIGRRTCPSGYSLAQDGKCYRNSEFKKGKLKKIPGGES